MLVKISQLGKRINHFPFVSAIGKAKCSNQSPDSLLSDINRLLKEPMHRNDSKMDSVMHGVRTLDPFANDIALNMAASHFTAMYHTLKMRKAIAEETNSDDVSQLKKERSEDLKFGWILLQNVVDNADSKDTKMEAVVLKLKFATTMKDFVLLREAYDSMLQILDSAVNSDAKFSDQQLMLCFTTASFLGDWHNVFKFGKAIHEINTTAVEAPTGGEAPTGFDIMYEICKHKGLHRGNDGLDSSQELKWETLPIRKIRIKLKSIDCEQFEEKRQEAMKEILGSNTLDTVEWEDVKEEYVSLTRMGAMCSTVSFCQEPLTLYGQWREDEINIMGRERFIDGSKQASVLEEEWDLKRNSAVDRLFEGTYRLSQMVELPLNVARTIETAPIHMIWDIEVYFSEPLSDS